MARKKTEQMPAFPEDWGIPDWTSIKAYGDVSNWTDERWRWEFFRRRRDLREFFDNWAVESRQFECNAGLDVNEPGFLAYASGEFSGQGIDRFGYAGIPNPRISNQPKSSIKPVREMVYRFRFNRGDKSTSTIRSVIPPADGQPRTIHEVVLREQEVAIQFDLNEPLTPQLQRATEFLRAQQLRIHPKLLQPRKNRAMWLSYLRALDGRAGPSQKDPAKQAPWSELARVFYEDGTLEPREAEDGTMKPPLPQSAAGLHVQGEKLKANF
ncbi:MAG: hypothetical protein QUV10_07700 [Paracoccaceae bacterium]|nr:hypothetical protein [Paracoccaceae bacterium]